MNPYVLLERVWKSYGVPPLVPSKLSAAKARELAQELGMGIGRPRLSAQQARELERAAGVRPPPVQRATAGRVNWRLPYLPQPRGRGILNPYARRDLAAATRGCGDRWATPEPSTGYGPRIATLNPPPAAVATVVEARRRYLGTNYVCDVELEHDAELGWHLAFYVPPLSFDVIPPPGEPTPADELSAEFGGMPVRIKGAGA